MKTNDLITRFLDGLTTPDEERQLRATLEAKTTLTADECTVLDLLCLSFPEEDTAALLAVDQSAEYDAILTTRPHHASTPLHYKRLWWALGIAAAVILAFLMWPEKHEVLIKQPKQHPVIAEAKQPQPVPKEKVEAETLPQLPHSITERKPIATATKPHKIISPQAQAQVQCLSNEESMAADDAKAQLCSAEIELEQAVHQRQAAYEAEMMQRSLELLIYIMGQEDEEKPTGGVKTQKS